MTGASVGNVCQWQLAVKVSYLEVPNTDAKITEDNTIYITQRSVTRVLELLCTLDNNNNLIFNVDTRRKWLPNLLSRGLILKRSTITS